MATPTPAWKRLGLELKYAKDEPDRPPLAVSTKANGHLTEASDRPAKRRRLAKEEVAESHGQNGTQSSSSRVRELKETEATNGSGSLLPDPQQLRQRKKSVTFSEETKQDDGDSRITIDFPAGSPGSTPKKSKQAAKHSPDTESPETLTSALKKSNSAVTSDQITPTKQAAKVKNGKKSNSSKSSTKDKSASALDYLNRHRSDRSSWKFNKILDVWILNHALDNQTIPSSHTPALAGYVRGLPEKAASRTRLVKECKEALPASQLDADTIEAERDVWIEFIDSQKGSLEAAAGQQDFLQSHSRPAVLLWALNEAVGPPQSATGAALAKKKKSRTSAPIDISSSSESDLDSDFSDDLSDTEEEDKPKSSRAVTKARSGATAKDETSSSGSSSEDDSENSSSDGTSSNDSSSEDDDES